MKLPQGFVRLPDQSVRHLLVQYVTLDYGELRYERLYLESLLL